MTPRPGALASGRGRSTLAAIALAARTVAAVAGAIVALAPLTLRRPGRRAASAPAGAAAVPNVVPGEAAGAAPPER